MEKLKIFDLALFGGRPAFVEPVVVGRPNTVNRDYFFSLVDNALDRKRLSNDGPYVRLLEEKIANYLGVSHCIAVCNGTTGLEIAIRVAGMTGEVIVPSFTYVSTPHSLLGNDITPVFCDIDQKTHNIDPKQIERLITHHTTGILGVHLWGRPCDIPALTKLADRSGLKLIFDAAHAFGCSYQGKSIGNFGDMEVFSFHATKFFNTIEGGAIVTNNPIYADRARQIRNLGFSKDGVVACHGTNAKMNEISAAMGLTMFSDLNSLIKKNLANYRQYRHELVDLPGLKVVSFDDFDHQNYQFIVLEIEHETTGISRDEILKVLENENVFGRRYFYPVCHRMAPYLDRPDAIQGNLMNTDIMSKRLLTLPTGNTVSEQDIRQICQIIQTVLTNPEAIKAEIQQPTRHAILQKN